MGNCMEAEDSHEFKTIDEVKQQVRLYIDFAFNRLNMKEKMICFMIKLENMIMSNH